MYEVPASFAEYLNRKSSQPFVLEAVTQIELDKTRYSFTAFNNQTDLTVLEVETIRYCVNRILVGDEVKPSIIISCLEFVKENERARRLHTPDPDDLPFELPRPRPTAA